MERLSWMNDQEWKDFKTIGLHSPVIEENGKIKMRNLVTGEYEFLSRESEIVYKRIQRERERIKRLNSPKEVYRRKRADERFWNRYAIYVREVDLLDALKRTKDPRLEEIINVRNGARELYLINNPRAGHTSINVQIAGARAILAYVEIEHADLYRYFQSACKWLNRREST